MVALNPAYDFVRTDGLHNWRIRDDEDAERVRRDAAEAARRGQDTSALLILLREVNPPGEALEDAAMAVKRAGELPVGIHAYRSPEDAVASRDGGIIVGRGPNRTASVLVIDVDGRLTTRREDWDTFWLQCEARYLSRRATRDGGLTATAG